LAAFELDFEPILPKELSNEANRLCLM
jgi:hypothetical protein